MNSHRLFKELPLPEFYNPDIVGEIWRVPYEERARQAREWARRKEILPAAGDRFKVVLILIDLQNTFCIPGYELFVGGRSGTGAVDDNRRLCEFIYRNLGTITSITATQDTHHAMQIFHAIMLVNDEGLHPDPYTLVTNQDILEGRWRFNPALAEVMGIDAAYGQEHLKHYTGELKERGKYDLTIWPYHAMLGGIGHALAASVEEAIFFHTIVRYSPADFEIKGDNSFTEHYSALGPEVTEGPGGKKLGEKSGKFLRKIIDNDAVIITGQAKSHCVAWTIADLLDDIRRSDESLAKKVYLLEDTTSPVVVPGVVDYTDQAEAAFQKFAEAGMHLVQSTQPMSAWQGLA